MAELLLGDMRLTPGQLAQLRAINTKYFTALYALQQKVTAERRAHGTGALPDQPPNIPESEMAALDVATARDIRDILADDQRAVLDRNWPRLGIDGQ